MHVESFDPRSFHPTEHSIRLPSSPSFDFVVIALARRCITLCVRFPFVLCSLRVPVRTRPFSPLSRVAFAFLAAPIVRFRCYFTPFDCACSASPAVCVPPPAFSHRARALPRPVVFPRLTSAPRVSYAQYSAFRRRCRCHVTRTNWSRALAASRLVGQDTTHPHYTLIPPHFRERSTTRPPRTRSCVITDR